MTIERIQAQTQAFAQARTRVITLAADLQDHINALIRIRHTELQAAVRTMTRQMQALDDILSANPELFPDGAKTVVIAGIKVGYQKGKDSVAIAQEDVALSHVLRTLADPLAPRADVEAYQRALKTKHNFIDAGLKRLSAEQLQAIGAVLQPAADSTLIKPVEEAAMKAVQSLIQVVMAEVEDHSA